MSGKGHPLPRSEEARHDEIPEHLEREKGCGDDAKAGIQPAGAAVAPDGEPYRYDVAQESRAPHGSALSGGLGRCGLPRSPQPCPGGMAGLPNGDLSNSRGAGAAATGDDLAEDQAAHRDRGQSVAEEAADRD